MTTFIVVVNKTEHDVDIQPALLTHGECSACAISHRIGIYYGSMLRSFRISYKRYPYKIKEVEELKSTDFTCQYFANCVFVQMEENAD